LHSLSGGSLDKPGLPSLFFLVCSYSLPSLCGLLLWKSRFWRNWRSSGWDMSHTQGGLENHWFLTWVSELTGNAIPFHFHHVIPIHIITALEEHLLTYLLAGVNSMKIGDASPNELPGSIPVRNVKVKGVILYWSAGGVLTCLSLALST